MAYRNFRRVAVPQQARQMAQPTTIAAPLRGWVTSESLAAAGADAAFILDNFFPTKTGITPRGGKTRHATIEDSVVSMFGYRFGILSRLFASDTSNIYDVTSPVDPEVAPAPSVAGQTNGEYSTEQFTTSGGTFLVVVNGADPMLLFDGTFWYPVGATNLYTLAYDGGTVAFTVGATVTGGTSAATAVIRSVVGGVASGTLIVDTLVGGPFQDNEALTGVPAGAALANGVEALQFAGITGVDTSLFSAVWSHQSRLFFIERGSMTVWFLAVDSITGVANDKSLGGLFKKGGSLLFGSTWSRDSGSGMDDFCVMVTTEGEAAIFQGIDPGGPDIGDFDLVGVYDIGKPLGKNATMRAGGDLLIATEDGAVPLSKALNVDVGALSLSAVTRPIEPEWQRQVRDRGDVPWKIAKWVSRNMAIVAIPAPTAEDEFYAFVVNIETGAWCRYTRWDVQALTVFNDRLFFGGLDGFIYEGEVTGADDGANIECVCVWHANHLKAVGATKIIHALRSVFTASLPFGMRLSVSTDYSILIPPAPNPATLSGEGWDLSTWDLSLWDAPGTARTIATRWLSQGATGFAISPQLQITSNSVPPLDAELVSLDFMFEIGGVLV